jgi:hypothetical protein
MIARRYTLDQAPSGAIELLDSGSLFSSPAFLNLWQSIKGRPILFAISETDSTVACLPGVEFGSGLLKRFQAMPDGLYATPLVAQPYLEQKDAICQLMLQAVADGGYVKAHVCDFHNRFPGQERFASAEAVTTVIDISGNDWAPTDRKIRGEIRKAEREGIGIRRFDHKRDFNKFIDLMHRVEKRHGRAPKYPPEFYDALAHLAAHDERVDWVWCEHEGQPAASHIYLVDGDLILGWQAFFDEEFSFLKPSQYILSKTVRSWAAKGVKRLNLGVSPTSEPTVEAYKRKWGGGPYHYCHLVYRSLLGRVL